MSLPLRIEDDEALRFPSISRESINLQSLNPPWKSAWIASLREKERERGRFGAKITFGTAGIHVSG